MVAVSRTALLLTSLFLFGAISAASAQEKKEAKPGRIEIWNKKAPVNNDGKTEEKEVFITVYRPEKPNGTAMVICPGGGYGGVVVGPEGHGIAKWLNKHGITGVVLEYRLPAGRSFVPLLDAQRALRTVRSRAKEWNLDADRIGIIGFSAGGHLASTAGTHFDLGQADSADPIQRVSCRPSFMILVYPVISMGVKGHGGSRHNLLGKNPDAKLVELFSNEKQVNDKTPPAFLAHARNDGVVVPENSKMFHEALRAAKVPSEYLELASGGHGLNGYKGPMWDAWQERSLAWLVEMKLVPAATAGSAAKAETKDKIRELQKKRLDALTSARAYILGELDKGKGDSCWDHLREASKLVYQARLDLCDTRAERVKTTEDSLKEAKLLVADLEKLISAGARIPNEAFTYSMWQAYSLELQIALERAKK